MKNTLADLNNYLFEQIERLSDDSLDKEQMELQLQRSDAVIKVAKTIIENGELALQAKKHLDQYGAGEMVEMPLLGISKGATNAKSPYDA